jgi:hypothetical protein
VVDIVSKFIALHMPKITAFTISMIVVAQPSPLNAIYLLLLLVLIVPKQGIVRFGYLIMIFAEVRMLS